MKYAVVIPAMNLWEKCTRHSIDSALKQKLDNGDELQVVVIDNASQDETQKEAQKMQDENKIKYIRNDTNIGCGPSWNQGIDYAINCWGADYVMVINNDSILHPDSCKVLKKRLEKSEYLLLVSAVDVSQKWSLEQMLLAAENDDKTEQEHPHYSAFMIDKRLPEICGEFDSLFYPVYFEDNDMHRRINLSGKKAICFGPAMFFHAHGGSQTQQSVEGGLVKPAHFEELRKKYAQKWGGVPGQEKFQTPYNKADTTIKSTKQNSE